MSDYISFWLAKVIVDLTVAGIFIAMLLSVYFYYGWRKRKAQENG